MTTVDFIESCLNLAPRDGFSVSEMGARWKALGEVKNKAEEKGFSHKSEGVVIDLEDANAAKVKECVEGMKWAIMHADIIEFSEAIAKECA